MKVIEINKLYHPWIGGVETHVKNIAEGLNKTANVEVVCCNHTNTTTTEYINDVKVTKYKAVGRLFSLPLSLSFILNLRSHQGDILHFHLPNPLAVLSTFITRPKGIIIITWHSDIVKQKFILFFYRPLLHWFLKKADHIITTSPNLADKSTFLTPYRDKITIIPLGINPHHYPKNEGPTESQRFALFVGRFIYYKGVIELIKAMKKTNVHVIMVGEGPLKEHILTQGKELIKNKRLTLYPFQDTESLNALFSRCEFFLLPSTHPSEAFGIVQLEAMIHSKPVISTNLPTGVPYVNQHNHTGLIVPPGNVDDLAQAMTTLWTNPSLTTSLGKNAYQRCISHFTEDQMIEKTKQLFKKALTNKE